MLLSMFLNLTFYSMLDDSFFNEFRTPDLTFAVYQMQELDNGVFNTSFNVEFEVITKLWNV